MANFLNLEFFKETPLYLSSPVKKSRSGNFFVEVSDGVGKFLLMFYSQKAPPTVGEANTRAFESMGLNVGDFFAVTMDNEFVMTFKKGDGSLYPANAGQQQPALPTTPQPTCPVPATGTPVPSPDPFSAEAEHKRLLHQGQKTEAEAIAETARVMNNISVAHLLAVELASDVPIESIDILRHHILTEAARLNVTVLKKPNG